MMNRTSFSVLAHLPGESFKEKMLARSAWSFCSRVAKLLIRLFAGIVVFFALYYAAACPPMHWFYDAASESAGPSSIYIPGALLQKRKSGTTIQWLDWNFLTHIDCNFSLGGGFSGFWFHLGFLQAMPNLKDYDYYCFSSGCLGMFPAQRSIFFADRVTSHLIAQNWYYFYFQGFSRHFFIALPIWS